MRLLPCVFLALSPLSFGQTSQILKTAEPNYGDELKKPGIILPVVVQMDVFPDGSPFSIESLDDALPDSVVRALMKYRFKSSPKGMRVTVSIPVRRITESYDGGEPWSLGMPDELGGKTLTLETAAEFERSLKPTKESVLDRTALLIFVSARDDEASQAIRARQVLWLVQNAPEAEVLRSARAWIAKKDNPAAYARIQQLWKDTVNANPANIRVLHGAYTFLRLDEPEEARQILLPYAGRISGAMVALGDLYALSGLGVTKLDPSDGSAVMAGDRLPTTPLSGMMRGRLVESNDLTLLLSALSTLSASARSLQAHGHLPEGHEALCTAVLMKALELKPNLTTTCAVTQPASEPSSVASVVTRGGITKQVRPMYPVEARSARIQGTVHLRAIIGKNGKISQLALIKGPIALYESARSAVSKWEYRPYLLNNQPVEVSTEIEVNYELR
ncbi:MAG: energy transducer TonB [Acidobacteriota bacterium]